MLPSLHRLCANRHGAAAPAPLGAPGDGAAEESGVPSKRPRRSPASPSAADAGAGPAPGSVAGPELAGVVLFFVAERRALAPVLFVQELLSLGVAPRTGVGLVHAMLRHPDARAHEEVQLVVRRSNAAATAFYERLGFAPLEDPERQAYEPLRGLELCMAARRADLLESAARSLGFVALAYEAHRNKRAFVLHDMWRFKEAVSALQAARARRGASDHPARVLPDDPRVRYLVATTAPRDTAEPGAI